MENRIEIGSLCLVCVDGVLASGPLLGYFEDGEGIVYGIIGISEFDEPSFIPINSVIKSITDDAFDILSDIVLFRE